MCKPIYNYCFVKMLKLEYNALSAQIDKVINEADKNTMILSFDDNGKGIMLSESIIMDKEYILSEIMSLSIIVGEKEIIDFAYAIQLFCEANNLIATNTHKMYGNELYKPVAQLILSIIDFELQKYSFEEKLDMGIKLNIEDIFIRILESKKCKNIILPDRLVLLFAYNFSKLIMLYDNDKPFMKLHNCINRNCIMHNSIFLNGKIMIPEVKKEDVLDLIAFYFNVVVFCHSQNTKQMKLLLDLIMKL